MKKLLLAIAAVAMLASCAKDDVQIDAQQATVSFNVTSPEISTRYGEGEEATTLYWAVYDSEEGYVEGISSGDENTKTLVNGSATVELYLVEGRSYEIVFWAQNAEAPYIRTWGQTASNAQIRYDDTVTLTANNEVYDAFFKYEPLGEIKGSITRTVELRRPFAQLNIATSDIDKAKRAGFDVVRTGVEVSNIFTSFGLKEGEVRGKPTTIVFDTTNKATGNITANGKSYEMLSMNYLLVGTKRLVDVKLMLQENNTVTNVLTRTYTSVPVERNYRTNIVGSILTNESEFNVEVRPGFNEGDLMKWDGEMISKPAYDAATNTYSISHGAELAWVAALVNGTLPADMRSGETVEPYNFAGATIVLNHDIDLGNKEWIPIGDYAFDRTKFSGTFDGRGYTIRDFKITTHSTRPEKADKGSYGLFGNMNGTIKNVNIENATITPDENGAYVGTLVGRLKEGGLIEECHIVNSVVTTTFWQAGGIVGQIEKAGNIKNSSIESSTITGGAAVGAIAGLIMNAGEYTIENCEVKQCHLVQNSSFGEGYDDMFGLAVGSVNNGAISLDLNNITVEENTIKGEASDLLVGYISGGAMVYIDGELVITLSPIEGAEGICIDNAGNYVITAAAGLDYIRTNISAEGFDGFAGKTITLSDDITLIDEDFAPIAAGTRSGSSATGTGFKGVFDGAGKIIKGLKITSGNANDAVGFFGVINGGEVKNVKFTDVAINVPSCENAGTVAGLVVNGGKISDVTVSGSVTAKRGNGGIAGRMMLKGTIENCTNNATISGTGANVAGIVGAAYYTNADGTMTIKNCTNNGTVTGAAGGVGGIVSMSAADIEGCTNNGAVTANGASVGGIVAEQQNAGSVKGCTNTADVTNNGASSNYGTGGIVGWVRYSGAEADYARKNVVEVSGNTNRGAIKGVTDAGGIVGVVYNYGIINNNKNYAATITATSAAAGIVGNAQFQETPIAMTDPYHVEVKNNVSTTAAENLSAALTDLYVYDNSQGAHLTVENNTPAEN